MHYHDNFREHLPFALTRTVDDTDPAFRVWYDGAESIASYEYDGADVIVTLGAVATTFAVATYTTIGALVDVLRMHDVNFHVVIAAARRDDLTAGLLTTASQDLIVLGEAGAEQMWDTSVCLFRKMAIGMEGVYQLLGRNTIAASKRSDGTDDVIRDPDIGDTLTPGKVRTLARGAKLESIVAKATFAGTTTIRFSKCGQTYDGAEVAVGQLVTATLATFRDALGVDGIMSQDGERIVVEIDNSPTVSTLTLVGAIGSIA